MTGIRNVISALLETTSPQNLVTVAPVPATNTETEQPGPAALSTPPEKEKPMAINTESEDYKAGVAASTEAATKAATAAANARFTAVIGSEHYAGREKLAATLLASDLTADAIVGALGDAPKAAPETAALTEEQKKEAAEAAAREEMKAALGQGKNSGIDANGGGKGKEKKADSGSVWDKAIALNNPGVKLG